MEYRKNYDGSFSICDYRGDTGGCTLLARTCAGARFDEVKAAVDAKTLPPRGQYGSRAARRDAVRNRLAAAGLGGAA